MPRRVLSTVALFAVGCLVAAIVFELGVRWLEPQPQTRYRFSPDTWFAPTPGAHFVYRRREFAVPVHFNAFGMRDVPRRLEKPPGGRRVALLGDSFAEALQVPEDSMLSRVLEKELGACLPVPAPEVLNFGTSGFGPAATAARYRSLARRFAPDVAIYLFVANDVTDMLGSDARLYEVRGDRLELRRHELGRVQRWEHTVADVAKAHLHSYRFLRYRLLRLGESERLLAARERGESAHTTELLPGDLAWERFEQALHLLRDLVRADGAALILAQATTFGPDMNARVVRLCASAGIPYLDLGPALARSARPVTYAIDGHWRPAGHRLAAQALAPVVCDLLQGTEPVPVLAR